jgi:para-aminobenzoate synthetase/4-amino-4-deoxychorismate lyase
MLQHKFNSAMWYVKVAADAKLDADDGLLLLNDLEHVVEELHNNIVIKIDGRYLTPPISDGPLPGVFIDYLKTKMKIDYQSITIEHLKQAQEIWLVNAVRGMRRATIVTQDYPAS